MWSSAPVLAGNTVSLTKTQGTCSTCCLRPKGTKPETNGDWGREPVRDERVGEWAGMVAVSGPQVLVISSGSGGAPRGPVVLPGCPAASLEPAAPVSGKPVNQGAESVFLSQGRPFPQHSWPTLPGWYSPHSSCPAWLRRAAVASWLCGARSVQPHGALCPLPVERPASHCCGPKAGGADRCHLWLLSHKHPPCPVR